MDQGDKERLVPFGRKAADALSRYLEADLPVRRGGVPLKRSS